ncbi:DNRLRE domain-containing protein, partial [candidate division KSB1 bacterium]|nr:DNRLRE domain-containing protein [candidate division KSB1 bacterium]
NRITFNRVFKNADLKYIYRPTSIEELLILSQEGRTSLPDPDLFGMNKNQTYLMIMSKIDLNGTLAAHALDEKKIQKKDVEVDDLIKFKDIKGNTKFFMPSDFAYTATANQDTSGMTKLEKMKRKILYKESEYYLFSGIPLKWLENQPTGDIVFDPIVELNFQPNNTEGYDNYLIYRENYSAYETYNAGSHSDLRVGRTYGNDFYIFRGLLKFDLSSIPTNVNIVSSILNLYAYYCSPYTGSTTIDIHKMNIYWEEGSQSYSPGKSNWHYRTQSDEWSQSGCQSGVDYESMVYATKTLTLSDDDSWIEFDIKDLTEYWVQNQSSNYGMMIKYQDDDVTITDNLHRYFRFYSSDATSNRPLLEVIYFEQETVTTYYVRDAAGNVIATYKR